MNAAREPQKFRDVSTTRRGRGFVVAWRIPGHRRTCRRVATVAAADALARRQSELVRQAKLGLVSPAAVGWAEAGRRPIADHVDDWRQSLADRRISAAQAALVVRRVDVVCNVGGIARIVDLTPARVAAAIAALRRDGAQRQPDPRSRTSRKPTPASDQTAMHYLRAVRQFSGWLVSAGRAAADPLRGMKGTGAEPRHRRRVLTDEELGRLIAAAEAGDRYCTRRATADRPARYLSGPHRALVYRLAMETGLRASEIAALTRSGFLLDQETLGGDRCPPAVWLPGSCTKKGRLLAAVGRKAEDVHQVISAELAEDLRPVLRATAAGVPVFPLPAKTAAMIREDLGAAGIDYQTAAGVFDFHALRYVCGSRLVAASVNLKVVQRVMRHSTISLTIDRYAKAHTEDLQAAIAKLPPLPSPAPGG